MQEMGDNVFFTDDNGPPQTAEMRQMKSLLQKLSDLINRPAATSQLGAGPTGLHRHNPRGAKKLVAERTARARFFDENLCAEPVWDILIDLYIRGREKADVSVSSACIASRVPQTTALRCLRALAADGVIKRTEDQHDARRIYLTLAPDIEQKMAAYLLFLEK
ncbi:MAG: MarR family transcriptional regulator [Sphingomonadales bacterium]|nr:MarR family transcriptional regulator [Sphingomonadales bacterium]